MSIKDFDFYSYGSVCILIANYVQTLTQIRNKRRPRHCFPVFAFVVLFLLLKTNVGLKFYFRIQCKAHLCDFKKKNG